MKLLFIISFGFICFSAIGQNEKNYNTHINKANKVEIKNGVINIKQADTVIIKIYATSKTKTKLFLTSHRQLKDSSGLYITTLLIKSPTESEYYDINIRLKLDKPMESISWNTGLGFGMDDKDVAHKTEPRLKMRKCECDEGITVIITSKEKILVSIYGIEGNL